MNKLINKPLSLAASLAWGLVAVAPFAQADVPALDAKSLGITESILKYCGPISPESVKKLQQKIDELVKGASAETVAKTRNSDEYRKAREMMDSFVAQVDEHNAKNMCSNSASDK
jgi:hypothetical protein